MSEPPPILPPSPSVLPLAPCTPERVADLLARVATADWEDPGDTDEDWEQTLAQWHTMLAGLDPGTAPDHGELVEAITDHLDSGVLDVAQECAWRGYAYHATRRLFNANDPIHAATAESYSHSLRDAGRHGEALAAQHDVIVFRRRAGDVPALLYARAQYARLMHLTGCCDDAAAEISTVWDLWRRDWLHEDDLGEALLDTFVIILLGCQRVADSKRIPVPRVSVARWAHQRCTDAKLAELADVDAHAAVCTYTRREAPATAALS